jgi:hypothetical protein
MLTERILKIMMLEEFCLNLRLISSGAPKYRISTTQGLFLKKMMIFSDYENSVDIIRMLLKIYNKEHCSLPDHQFYLNVAKIQKSIKMKDWVTSALMTWKPRTTSLPVEIRLLIKRYISAKDWIELETFSTSRRKKGSYR